MMGGSPTSLSGGSPAETDGLMTVAGFPCAGSELRQAERQEGLRLQATELMRSVVSCYIWLLIR